MLTLLFSSLLAFASPRPLFVMVDPGHGGRDHGTVKNGTREADITLAVSAKLAGLLRQDPRFRVELTRQSDESLSLFRRARLTKDKRAALFLSIHVNSSPDRKARGAEFYFQNELPPDQESMFLAHKENVTETGDESAQPVTYDFLDQHPMPGEVAAIVGDLLDDDRILKSSELSRDLKQNWHGSRKSQSNSVRQAPFYVLSQPRSPSALVELGFLTNDEDFHELTNPQMQAKMAEDLYHGLLKYKESMDKRTQSP